MASHPGSGICYPAVIGGLRLRLDHLSVVLVHDMGAVQKWLEATSYSDIAQFEPVQCRGYFAGGMMIKNARIVGDNLLADDVAWHDSSIRATGAYLMQGSDPIAYFDFNGESFSNHGTFSIQWDNAGMIRGLSGHGLGLEAPEPEPPSPSSNSELLDAIEVYLEHR